MSSPTGFLLRLGHGFPRGAATALRLERQLAGDVG
jgi:hypothetical protein